MQPISRIRPCRALVLLFAVAMTAALAGCGGGYALRGHVLKSSHSAVTVTDRNDERLTEPGIGEVQIRVFRDPGRLSQELVASGYSRPDGSFDIPLNAFGAGWMDEQWLVQAYRSGYQNVESIMRLPSNTNRQPLLILMTEGRGVPPAEPEDLLREHDQYR